MENIFIVQSVNFVKTRKLPSLFLLCASLILLVAGCATESHRALTPETVPSSKMVYQGVKHVLVVGKF